VLCGLVARGIPIFAVTRHLRIETFVAGLAQGLLESPAVPPLSAAGVRTIVWQHALVGFAHGRGAHFKNLVLEQSVFASSVVCVWTPSDRDQLIDRALLEPPKGPTLSITGPLMPGDSRWLRRTPTEARQAVGLDVRPGRQIISVFDLPTFMQGFRRQYRIPVARISQETQQAFFKDILATLLQFSEVDIVLKPKRGNDPRIYVGRVLQELSDLESSWRKSARLFLLNPDIDPYLPIALADLCIGMPFTSPVVAAVNAGRPAFWYDPNGFVSNPYPPDLAKILVRGQGELFARLAAWLAGEVAAPPATIMSGISDPGVAFAGILKGSEALDESFDVQNCKRGGTP
jgi:polysaccharide biosynthesis PFTS motif protein